MKKTQWLFLAMALAAGGCGGGDDDSGDDTHSDEMTPDEMTPDEMTPDEMTPDEMTVPTATSIKFAANGVDCGLTDGFADQQHVLPELIHLNTDKCNGETFRPTFTLNFEAGQEIMPGTYTVAPAAGPMEVEIVSEQYNYTSWDGTGGSVVVTRNADDATKLDLELKSIEMTNRSADTDTKNPATDIVTGYIIGI